MNNELVNKEDVLDIIQEWWCELFHLNGSPKILNDRIKSLHAVAHEQKTGHWEYGYAFADGNYCKCSECKEIIKCIYPMHYCPNCGAKMCLVESKNK